MSNPFRYPLIEPSYGHHVPERPWWVQALDRATYTRRGGLQISRYSDASCDVFADHVLIAGIADAPKGLALLAHLDELYPMPAPMALCNQVWSFPQGGGRLERTIVAIDNQGDICWGDSPTMDNGLVAFVTYAQWPPTGALLVDGPLAPWALPTWSPS